MLSRRRLLHASLSVLAAALARPCGVSTAVAKASVSKQDRAIRWGMAVDMTLLSSNPKALARAIQACHTAHNVPDIPYSPGKPDRRVAWLRSESPYRVFAEGRRAGLPGLPASVQTLMLPALCNHCDDPPCVRVCPTGATFQDNEGRVAMDPHRCIGCRYCMAACPYGARSFNFSDPAPFISSPSADYPLRQRGIVEKCTFCPERTALGKLPYCVEASDGVLRFGNLLDTSDTLNAMLAARPSWRRKLHLGTGPVL